MNRSSSTFNEFPWPRLPGSDSIPHWTGTSFIIGNVETKVLVFGESESAWSDELTAMHEAEAASAHPMDLASRRLAVESMREFADRPGRIILDIGCSSGFLIQDFIKFLPNVSIFGADYLTGIVHKAARRNPGIPFVQFDLRKCPLPDQCVDGVTALNVLEHIDDDVTALCEIYRTLKPGGIAHLEVPAGPSCRDMYDEVLMHFRRYRLRDLTALASRAGFTVERATHIGFLAYPAFVWVKQINRIIGKQLTIEEKRRSVAQHISKTAGSRVLKAVLGIELLVGKLRTYPFGIRAVVRLRRNDKCTLR
jgi:ubiquinone/menaquinone biosynthesis C-methylase UbiE